MKKYLFFPLVMLGLVLSACSSDDAADVVEVVPNDTTEVAKLPISIGTRAHDWGFHDGDRVGVYVVNSKNGEQMPLTTSGNHVNNQPFTYEWGTWTSSRLIYWADSETQTDFYCYYPYSDNVGDVNNYVFVTPTDQSDEAKYSSADFMWCRQEWVHPSTDCVSLNLHRKMSLIIVELQSGDFDEGAIFDGDLRVIVGGLKIYSSINLADGTVTAFGNTSTISTWRSNGYNEFKAVVPPQYLDSSAPFTVVVYCDGKKYHFSREFTFNGGKQYRFNLQLRKSSGMDVGIDNWTEEDVDYGGVVE